ncbi:MAG: alpha/beta fold hydrolase [Candidatus Dormibacteraeota bacterium]|jgi:carboxylesterase|nr:alpha/beta fold hydrolase [Candidatus Dormibacteraeota bacterium]
MCASRSPTIAEQDARPYWLGDGSKGVLLLHGFAGTPPELRLLAEWLAARGFVAYAPLLAGHGTTPEEMAKTGRWDWIRSANGALDALLERCPHVGVAGQSMGATLALHLAATRPEIEAVVSQAGLLYLTDWRLRLLPALQGLVRWEVPSDEVDLYRLEGLHDLHSYDRRPTRAILELVRLGRLVRSEMPAVVRPLLVLHGGRDGVVDPANADQILALASSPIRAYRRFERTGHGMSVDIDRHEVADLAGRWLERFVGAP